MNDRVDLVFLGPSLSLDEAKEIYPEAIYLPPASMGDVLSAMRKYRPHAIALIDGSFFQTMATYHKELVEALSQGIWVIGASSMGALRAAECAEYGMIGVGAVYEAYASGEIEDDDEVALSHVSEEFGFRPVTEAMVDIRASLAAAEQVGIIDHDECRDLCARQKSRWFMERNLMTSVEDARELGMAPERVDALARFLRTSRVSLKADDARLAIARLRDLPDSPLPEADRPVLPYSRVYDATSARDVVVHSDMGDPITLDKIRRFVTLTDPRTPEIWTEVRRRAALHRLMAAFGVEVDDEALDRARAALAADLGVSVAQFADECRDLDMTPAQVDAWVKEEAYIRRAEEWVGGHAMYTLFNTEFLNHLRRSGDYRAARRGAAFQERVAESSPHRHTQLGMAAAMAVYQQLANWEAPEDLDDYLAELNLGSRAEFYERLMTAVAAGMELFGMKAIDPSLLGAADDDMDHAMTPKNTRGG